MSYIEFLKSGNLVLPGALLFHFKEVFNSPEDFVVWQYIYLQNTKNITNIATSDIAKVLNLTVQDVNQHISSLQNSEVLDVKTIAVGNDLEMLFDSYLAFAKLEEVLSVEEGQSVVEPKTSDDELKKLYQVFEQEMGMLSPLTIEEIQKLVLEDNMSSELITEALRQAVRNRKVTMSYIKGILRNWRKEGITTVRQVAEQQEERQRQQSGQYEITDEFRNAMNLWSD